MPGGDTAGAGEHGRAGPGGVGAAVQGRREIEGRGLLDVVVGAAVQGRRASARARARVVRALGVGSRECA
jgi:hypothetical protein